MSDCAGSEMSTEAVLANGPAADLDPQTKLELEAAAFRGLVMHLQDRKDVQNIDLMNLAGFCRKCLLALSKAVQSFVTQFCSHVICFVAASLKIVSKYIMCVFTFCDNLHPFLILDTFRIEI